MIDVNYAAIAVAAVAAFLVGFVYYMMLGNQLQALGSGGGNSDASPAWLVPVELLRSLVVAAVLAGLIGELEIAEPAPAAVLGFALWVAFPVVLLSGSVVHENVPWKLAAIHAGDWLAKLLIIVVIISVWA